METMLNNRVSTILSAIEWVHARFEGSELHYGHGSDNPWDEACYLVLSAMELPLDADESMGALPVSDHGWHQIEAWTKARIETRKPLSYLVGRAWFCGLPFYVNESVLIPRSPLAELILSRFEPWVSSDKPLRILDLCTGSGCIALAIAGVFEDAEVVGTDISPDALRVADKNLDNLSAREDMKNLKARVRFVQADVFDCVDGRDALGAFDVIIANPPYVDQEEMDRLPLEYRHEPVLGLESGGDGLDVTRRILMGAYRHLNENGVLLCEVGASKAHLEEAFLELPFVWFEFESGAEGVFLLNRQDLAGL